MASKGVVAAIVVVLSVISLCAGVCVPDEPNVDCNFHSLVAADWPELSSRSEELSTVWRSEAAKAPIYPARRFSGRGLVVTARTIDMVNVPVLLSVLQSQGFELPVEVWYSGEIDADVINTLSSAYKNLVIRNLANYASAEDLTPTVTSQGTHVFQAKVLAILNSAFEEVLFLDADNVPLSNPTALFDAVEYKRTGALFWPDFWQTASENPIWAILGISPQPREQESGQILLNKKQVWKALYLALFFAKDATFQKMINGDKEAFRLAFLATGTPVFMVETPVGSVGAETDSGSFCGHTMVQHDLSGNPMFLHHNSLKHGAAISWTVMKSVAAGKRFSVVPLPAATFNGDDVACLDLAGADVSSSRAPFNDFENIYARFQAATDESLISLSRNEFLAVQFATRRKLLASNSSDTITVPPGSNGVCNASSPNPNQCYSRFGMSSVCCSTSCSGQYVNPDPAVDSPQTCVGGAAGASSTGNPPSANSATGLSIPGPCNSDYPNACWNAGGSFFICCKYAVGMCGPSTPNGDPTCQLVPGA